MLLDAHQQWTLAKLWAQQAKTTDSDARRALAGGLQALAAKLTEAQARASASHSYYPFDG
jgi:hypothetical protein